MEYDLSVFTSLFGMFFQRCMFEGQVPLDEIAKYPCRRIFLYLCVLSLNVNPVLVQMASYVFFSFRMAEVVKKINKVIKKEVQVGSCVSISRSYFGIQYGAQLSDHIVIIIGRVTYVYSGNTCKVLWDLDNTESLRTLK